LNNGFSVLPTEVDTGCVQENFIQINFEKTFQKLEQFFNRADERIAEETQWLKENEIDLVLTDASSLPLKACKALGIPSILICNFIWHDIYSHFPGSEKWQGLLDALKEEYAQATLQILPQCHIVNDIIDRTEEVGFIARKGKNIKTRLEQVSRVSLKDKTIVFIYLGDMGAQSVAWENINLLKDIIFITRDPLPKNLPNLFVLDENFLYQDLIASSDIVFTKAGYSTLATAFAHGKPVLSCSREHFSEFSVMQNYLHQKQVGFIMKSEKFFACDWEEDIRKVKSLSIDGKVPLNGEDAVMKIIDRLLQE
jgi:UDP-N-acetylglucosamine transferase subunit ALG13